MFRESKDYPFLGVLIKNIFFVSENEDKYYERNGTVSRKFWNWHVGSNSTCEPCFKPVLAIIGSRINLK